VRNPSLKRSASAVNSRALSGDISRIAFRLAPPRKLSFADVTMTPAMSFFSSMSRRVVETHSSMNDAVIVFTGRPGSSSVIVTTPSSSRCQWILAFAIAILIIVPATHNDRAISSFMTSLAPP
jgi:hypothetical protein